MTKLIDLTGRKFGRLVALEAIKGDRIKWRCLCDCGNVVIIDGGNLREGYTTSCGCFRSEVSGTRNKTHGLTDTPEYNVWMHIKARCLNPHNKSFSDYGGRDIKICDRWIESFDHFISDMGSRPSSKHTIERIDNSGDYSPENCRWATRHEQNQNKRNVVKYFYNGEEHTITEWAKIYNVNRDSLYDRVYRGIPFDKALTEPFINGYHHKHPMS
jgi:hypothetical protein